jgi:hypothetical protein
LSCAATSARLPPRERRDEAVKRGSTATLVFILLLLAGSAVAQNLISQGSWEGFAMRDADNKFDRCVLYNRSVEALTASPYQMLGITRDAAGHIGLLVFYDPRTLTRGDTIVRLKLDQRAAVSVPGDVLSDFHVSVAKLDPDVIAALRDTKSLDATVSGHAIHFDLSDVGGVLDRLDACVKIYGPKS